VSLKVSLNKGGQNMALILFLIHIGAWITNIVVGVRLNKKHGSTPSGYSGGRPLAHIDPMVAGIVIGAIPVLNVIFAIWGLYEWKRL
jgi:hypothetical protein